MREDLKEIKKQFDEIITYNYNIDNPKTDELFENWRINKSKFINMFGDKLIYEFPEPIEITMNPEEQNEKIENFIKLICYYNNKELAEFVNKNKKSFFDNKVIVEMDKAEKGMKLIKSFKFFENDKNVLNEIQSKASMIIQENKVKGTLCASVHPLDFLSISENNSNWSSCHSLDGEYAAGNLSYMQDNSTVIFYLKSKEKVNLLNFPKNILWNNKKWRQLVFFSDYRNFIYAGRPYPFESNYLTDLIIKKFLTNYKEWTPLIKKITINNKEEKLYEPCIFLNGRLETISSTIIDSRTELHYNDLLRSSYYKPVVAINKHPLFGTDICHIGSNVKCLLCGENYIQDSQYMKCEDCIAETENYELCDCCERRIICDNEEYDTLKDGTVICAECADAYTRICDCCDERVYNEDLIYYEALDEFLCEDCYNSYQKIKEEKKWQ